MDATERSLPKNGPGEEESRRRNYAVEAEELRSEDKHTDTHTKRALIHHERISPAARDEETLVFTHRSMGFNVRCVCLPVCQTHESETMTSSSKGFLSKPLPVALVVVEMLLLRLRLNPRCPEVIYGSRGGE